MNDCCDDCGMKEEAFFLEGMTRSQLEEQIAIAADRAEESLRVIRVATRMLLIEAVDEKIS